MGRKSSIDVHNLLVFMFRSNWRMSLRCSEYLSRDMKYSWTESGIKSSAT